MRNEEPRLHEGIQVYITNENNYSLRSFIQETKDTNHQDQGNTLKIVIFI